MNVSTVTVNYVASQSRTDDPRSLGVHAGSSVGSSTINIPDNFLIQGLTAANRGGIRVSFEHHASRRPQPHGHPVLPQGTVG